MDGNAIFLILTEIVKFIFFQLCTISLLCYTLEKIGLETRGRE